MVGSSLEMKIQTVDFRGPNNINRLGFGGWGSGGQFPKQIYLILRTFSVPLIFLESIENIFPPDFFMSTITI